MAIRIQPPFTPIRKPLVTISKSAFFALPNRRRLSISASAMIVTPPAATATLYELLTVPKTAGPGEIRAAFRRQARQWHPDVCPTSSDQNFFAEQLIRAREAYEVLSDPDLRQDYDLRQDPSKGGLRGAVRRPQMGGDRSGTRFGGEFGDWESQLEGLERRSAARVAAAATST